MILRFLGSLFAVILIAGCFHIFTAKSLPFVSYDRTVAPGEIQKNGTNSYVVSVPLDLDFPLLLVADSTETGHTASNLQIFENQAALGPAHSSHKEIADEGAGRFSHWGVSSSNVIFSTSDNTDPRSNGRTYRIIARPQVPPVVLVLAIIPLMIFLIQRLLSARLVRVGEILLSLVVLSAWIYLIGRFVPISLDSFTYAKWSPLVPLGYPLFLSAIRSLAWVPAIQLVMLSAACLFLTLAAARFSKAAGLGALLVLLCSTPVFYSQPGILSESLLIPLLLANVAAAIFLIFEQKKRWAIIVGATAALVMFVRPAGYFAPLGVIFLCLALPYPKRWLIRWAALPLVSILLFTVALNYIVRGSAAQSQVGRILFPQVALIFEPGFAAEQDRDIANAIGAALKPHQAKYRQAADFTERFFFSCNNFNSWLSASDLAVYARFAALDTAEKGSTDGTTYFRRLEALYIRLFFRTVAHDPIGYMRIIRDQLAGAWYNSVLSYPAPVLAIFSAEEKSGAWRPAALKQGGLDIGSGQIVPDAGRSNSWAGTLIGFLDKVYHRIQTERWLIYIVGLATLIAIPFSIMVRATNHTLALAYCGVIIHGSMLLTAVVTVFIPRYALPIDPVIFVAGVIMIDGLLSWVLTAMRTGPQPYRGRTAV